MAAADTVIVAPAPSADEQTFLDRAATYFMNHEGVEYGLYNDVFGIPTIGVGWALKSAKDAWKHPFKHKEDGRPATKEEITAEWEKIKRLPSGLKYSATFYRQYQDLILPRSEIIPTTVRYIKGFIVGLRNVVPKFDEAPMDARLGMLDMAYSLGVMGWREKYPKMFKACVNGDWRSAAEECRRKGVSETRNNACRDLFLSASKAEVEVIKEVTEGEVSNGQ